MSSILEFLDQKFNEIDYLQRYDTGGQKIVFKGEHRRFGDIVLKIISVNSDNSIKRALRELKTASSLKGRHYAQVFEYNEFIFNKNKYIYIIEKFMKGTTLRNLLIKKEKLNLEDTMWIGKDLLEALIPIHSLNLVHRDIKPENIIIADRGIVLLDFGIVRDLNEDSITKDVQFFGPMTIGYAAPEQIKNDKKIICNRTDLFGWGIIMYECLSGNHPFKDGDDTPQSIIQKSLNYNPPRLQCKNEVFSDMITKCLNKSVHRRPLNSEYILKILR